MDPAIAEPGIAGSGNSFLSAQLMRVFAVSDLHVDYAPNLQWVLELSMTDYRQDILLLAGDISDDLALMERVFLQLRQVFNQVLFVPGNHDLWLRGPRETCSVKKFEKIQALCRGCDIIQEVYTCNGVRFVPLLGWYDYSFAPACAALRRSWRDYRRCVWPDWLTNDAAVNSYFLGLNTVPSESGQFTISYSHFVPDISLMPEHIPQSRRVVYPVLGSSGLGRQVEQLNPDLHVYGHSHVNRAIRKHGRIYVNNAFAYPAEGSIARKALHCVYEPRKTEIALQCPLERRRSQRSGSSFGKRGISSAAAS